MPAKMLAAVVLLAVAQLASAQIPFHLGRVAGNPAAAPSGDVTLRVTVVGSTLPPESVLSDETRWSITGSGQGSKFTSKPTKPAVFDPVSGVVAVVVPGGKFCGVTPAKCSWRATFHGADGRNLDATQDASISDTFSLRSVSGSAQKTEVTLQVRASGIAPSGTVDHREYWRVLVSDAKGNHKAIQPVEQATYRFRSGFVTLTFPVSELGMIQAKDAKWSVAFLPPDATLIASGGGGGDSALEGAKSRDDADLYLSASYIAGVGTKPLWMIDAKAGYSDAPEKIPVLNSFVKSSPANLRFGIYGEIATNADGQTPVDRTQVDPDSILGYTTVSRTIRLQKNPVAYALKWELQPIGGEFSRKYPASNLVSGGQVSLIQVLATKKAWGADLIPSVGFEGGKNLNKPAVLFERPVDLSGYDDIVRLRGGAAANLYVFRHSPTPDDTYAFTLNGSWTVRVPFTAEPFTTSAYLPDPTDPTTITRQQVVSMRTNARHDVQVTAAWNVSKLFGLQLEYKYGSLPPMFEFVSHQISVGLSFKAAFKQNHSVTNPLH